MAVVERVHVDLVLGAYDTVGAGGGEQHHVRLIVGGDLFEHPTNLVGGQRGGPFEKLSKPHSNKPPIDYLEQLLFNDYPMACGYIRSSGQVL